MSQNRSSLLPGCASLRFPLQPPGPRQAPTPSHTIWEPGLESKAVTQQKLPSESPRAAAVLHREGTKTACLRDPAGRELGGKMQKQGLFWRVRALSPHAPCTWGPGLRTVTQWGVGLEVDRKEVSPCLCLLRTFNYILRELPKVPTHVPVCVLGNYRDMGEHRVILPDDVRDFIDNLDRWVGRPCWGRTPACPASVAPAVRVQQEDLGPRTAEPGVGRPAGAGGARGRAAAVRPLPLPKSRLGVACWALRCGPWGRRGAGFSLWRGGGSGIRSSLVQVWPLAWRDCAPLPTTSHLHLKPHVPFANRPPGSSYFRYAESSMKNSFGLKYLHKFFNIPFLQLQVSVGRGGQHRVLRAPLAPAAPGWPAPPPPLCQASRTPRDPLDASFRPFLTNKAGTGGLDVWVTRARTDSCCHAPVPVGLPRRSILRSCGVWLQGEASEMPPPAAQAQSPATTPTLGSDSRCTEAERWCRGPLGPSLRFPWWQPRVSPALLSRPRTQRCPPVSLAGLAPPHVERWAEPALG